MARNIISIRTFDPVSRQDHGVIEIARGGDTFDDITTRTYVITDWDHYWRRWNQVDDACYNASMAHIRHRTMSSYVHRTTN